jgi:hypothetical protein
MTAPILLERLRAARFYRQRTAVDIDALVRDSIGLHSTDYATPYLSAWARIDDFDPAALASRLNRADGLVRVNAMRNTVHVVHVDDLATILAACGPAAGLVGRRTLKALSDAEIDAGVAMLVGALADGPRSTNELKDALPSLGSDLRSWMLVAMGRGEVLRADAAHPRSNRTRYARTVDRVPGYQPVPADKARRSLLLRAVAAFGPLTVDDLAWWLPAPKGEVVRALASGTGLAHLEPADPLGQDAHLVPEGRILRLQRLVLDPQLSVLGPKRLVLGSKPDHLHLERRGLTVQLRDLRLQVGDNCEHGLDRKGGSGHLAVRSHRAGGVDPLRRFPQARAAGATQVDAFEERLELGGAERDAPVGAGLWPAEPPLLEALVQDDEASLGPPQHLRPIPSDREEDEQGAGEHGLVKLPLHQSAQAVGALAHVGGLVGEQDAQTDWGRRTWVRGP